MQILLKKQEGVIPSERGLWCKAENPCPFIQVFLRQAFINSAVKQLEKKLSAMAIEHLFHPSLRNSE